MVDLARELEKADARVTALAAENAQLKESFELEREDATQWLREEAKERARADALEAEKDALHAQIVRVGDDKQMLEETFRALRAERDRLRSALEAQAEIWEGLASIQSIRPKAETLRQCASEARKLLAVTPREEPPT